LFYVKGGLAVTTARYNDIVTATGLIVACGSGNETRCGDDIVVTGGGYREAALHIEQRIAPGITDLSGEKPEGINPRAIGEIARKEQKCIAHLGAAQAHPIALRLKPEHPGVALRAK